MNNALNWFEIPTTDFDRAVTFYSTILGQPLRTDVPGGIPTAVLPHEAGQAVGGSLVRNPLMKPGVDGPTVYLNCNGIMDTVIARVPAAGGTVLMPRTDTRFGSIAFMIDSEGNRIGLHAE